MKRKLIIFLIVVLIGFVLYILTKNTSTKISAQAVCPTDPIGTLCLGGQNLVYEDRPTADCSNVFSLSTGVTCDMATYSTIDCNNPPPAGGNPYKCTTGQVCDCGGTGQEERCRIPGKTPNGIACCSDQVCQSGYCNQTTKKCDVNPSAPTATPTSTMTPTPTGAITPTITPTSSPSPTVTPAQGITRKDVPYRPSFNTLLKNALFLLPVFLIVYLIF